MALRLAIGIGHIARAVDPALPLGSIAVRIAVCTRSPSVAVRPVGSGWKRKVGYWLDQSLNGLEIRDGHLFKDRPMCT